MKNLNQIRAASALAHRNQIASSSNGGDAISGFPMLVLTDGLLAALAFAVEEKEIRQNEMPNQNAPNAYLFRQIGQGNQARYLKRKHDGEFTIARAIADHLSADGIELVTSDTADTLVAELAAENDDLKLRRATAEALRFLAYLKRFVA